MKKRSKKRGMTLIEMVVALAVVAVMITMVASFTVVLRDRVNVSRAMLAAQQDLDLIESGAEGWITSLTEQGAVFTAEDNKIRAVIAKDTGSEAYTLTFANGALSGTLPEGKTVTWGTEQTQAATFSLITEEDGSDVLFFCTVTYEIPQAENDTSAKQTHTFCINPRVGEIITGGTNETTQPETSTTTETAR